VLCTHWLNDGGQYKDRLWDIYYAIENRPPGFDWDLCLASVSPIRRNWVITAIAVTKKYLDLNVDSLPFADELHSLPKWLEKTLEKEWSTELRLRPLHSFLNEPSMLFKQLKKRFPPNPIQATIETESAFDDRSVFPRQIKNIVLRVPASVKRASRQIGSRLWR
jgi:hypothetical protein